MLSARRLKLMKRDAYLVNTARGEVIDENALVRMIEAGDLAGAGLDVFEHEPAVNPKLVRLAKQGRVVLLPHMGSATLEGRIDMGEKVIRQHQDLDGRPQAAGPGAAVDAVSAMKKTLADIEPRRGSNYPPPFSDVVAGRLKHALGNAFGLDQFGVNLTELAPGAASALRHWHSAEDEFVYILSGEVVLETMAANRRWAPATSSAQGGRRQRTSARQSLERAGPVPRSRNPRDRPRHRPLP